MGSGMCPGRHLCCLVFCREIGTPISGSRLVYGNQALGVKHLNSWVTFLNKLAYHSHKNGNYGFSYGLHFSLYCYTQGRCSSKLLPGGSTQLIGLLRSTSAGKTQLGGLLWSMCFHYYFVLVIEFLQNPS